MIKIDSNIFVIFEDQNIYIEIDLTKGTIIKKKYKNYLQSELTLKYLQKLISNKKIKLTKLEEALFTHKPLINTFNNHLKLISNNRKLSIT